MHHAHPIAQSGTPAFAGVTEIVLLTIPHAEVRALCEPRSILTRCTNPSRLAKSRAPQGEVEENALLQQCQIHA